MVPFRPSSWHRAGPECGKKRRRGEAFSPPSGKLGEPPPDGSVAAAVGDQRLGTVCFGRSLGAIITMKGISPCGSNREPMAVTTFRSLFLIVEYSS